MDQDSQNTDYLFDFLYVDKPRISSYSAQIYDDGVLVGLKSTQQTSESKSADFKGDAFIAAAGFGGKDTLSEAVERQFDSSWSLPLNVIAKLHEDGFVCNDIGKASIGGMVLVKGSIALLDIKLLKDMWEPAFSLALVDIKPTHANKAQIANEKTKAKSLGELLAKLPSTVQVFLKTEQSHLLWAALSPEHLTIDPSDLGLKYGSHIDGEWRMLCVVDARPDDGDQKVGFSVPSDLFNGVMGMMRAIRTSSGRPATAFGVSPIAIFRAIRKPTP